MIEPRYMPLTGYPKGWSGSTAGTITATPVWLPNPSSADLQHHAGTLKGAVVMNGTDTGVLHSCRRRICSRV